MVDFIVKLIDPKNDYTKIVTFILIYLASLWILFCFWVFIDSQKRFKNFAISTIFFFLVLILNLPALIFYLIIRPEKDDENVFYLHHEGMEEGGVNVPIVNFVGKNGVEMTLQIKINKPAEVADSEGSNMNVNVEWNDRTSGESEPSDFVKVKRPLTTGDEEDEDEGVLIDSSNQQRKKELVNKKIGTNFAKLKAGIASMLKKKEDDKTSKDTKLVNEEIQENASEEKGKEGKSNDKVEIMEESVEKSTKES